jgi:UDP-2-acetamido-3-amino-2,3-dideoxy-glucuronate N-acetyltransferase
MIHQTAIVETEQVGNNTKIWAFSHICQGAKIGKNCVIGEGVYIGPNVVIGDNVKIQNHSLIYEGVKVENDVFIGPNVVTTNDIYPRAVGDWKDRFRKTLICRGASIGANSTILCGITIGSKSLVGAGSVVTRSIPKNTLVYGNPAKIQGEVKDASNS